MILSNFAHVRTLVVLFTGLCLSLVRLSALDATVQAKLDAQVAEITHWAADPVVVAAVKAQNAALPEAYAALDQTKWKALKILDPLVRGFSKNEAGQFLKSKKSALVTEAFLNDAAGFKVAFIAKTSGWCHKGKAKHDVPMTGKSWQGEVEVDESSGMQQIQVAVPVLEEGHPIGSLVVGLSVSQLAH